MPSYEPCGNGRNSPMYISPPSRDGGRKRIAGKHEKLDSTVTSQSRSLQRRCRICSSGSHRMPSGRDAVSTPPRTSPTDSQRSGFTGRSRNSSRSGFVGELRRRLWRTPVMGALLVRISEPDDRTVFIGPSHERDPGGKVVGRESRRHRDDGNEHEEGVERRHAFLAHIRRIHAVLDECRLVLDRLVYNRIQTIGCLHLHKPYLQRVTYLQVIIVTF